MMYAADVKTRETYCALMREASERCDVISSVLGGQSGLSPPLKKELCYLQLRLICEVIALACLVAHGDIPVAKSTRLQKAWEADLIIRKLGNVREGFYPRPVRRQPAGERQWHFENFTGDFLTKEDLISLVLKAGKHLHRGSVKALLVGRIPVQESFPEISSWATKIRNLLEHHAIFFEGGVYLFQASDPHHSNKSTLVLAEAVD